MNIAFGMILKSYIRKEGVFLTILAIAWVQHQLREC